MTIMDLVTIEGKWDFNYTYFAGESASRGVGVQSGED